MSHPVHEELAAHVDAACHRWGIPLEAWQRDYLERAFAAFLRDRLGLTDGAS